MMPQLHLKIKADEMQSRVYSGGDTGAQNLALIQIQV